MYFFIHVLHQCAPITEAGSTCAFGLNHAQSILQTHHIRESACYLHLQLHTTTMSGDVIQFAVDAAGALIIRAHRQVDNAVSCAASAAREKG